MIRELALKLMAIGNQKSAEAELRAFAMKIIKAYREARGTPKPIRLNPSVKKTDKLRLSIQDKVLLDYLQKNGSITNVDAITQLCILRIASRIGELRAAGYDIECKRVEGGMYKYTLL